MKSTGIIRKIDDLGRIVIPKEIRNVLGIESGDDLEIYVENNSILLTKYSHMFNNKSISNKLIESLDSLIDANIYVTDKNIVVTNGDLENKNINNRLKSLIIERKKYISKDIDEIKFNELVKKGYFVILPIIQDSNSNGLLIIYKRSVINDEDILFANILKNIIENK